MNPMLAAALAYASRGLSVVPIHGIRDDGSCTCGNAKCASPGKHAIGKWRQLQERALTPDELRAVYARYPGANVGIVTGRVSELVVLDIDGEEGMHSLRGLGLGDFRAPVVATGRGLHVYFQHPGAGIEVANSASKRLAGLDIRGDGGLVVAPPSRHHSGTRYEWAAGFSLEDAAPPPAPECVLALAGGDGEAEPGRLAAAPRQAGGLSFTTADARPPVDHVGKFAAHVMDAEAGRVLTAPEGQRNATLNAAAFALGQLVGAGAVEQSAVEARLVLAANRAGLGDAEAAATIKSGVDAGMRQPRDLSHVGTGSRPAATAGGSVAVLTPGAQAEFAPLDRSMAEHARRPAPRFPVDVLGPFWADFATRGAEAAGAPVDYVAGPLLAGVSAIIGNARWVSPWGGWKEPPIIWIGMVGAPSSGKTPGKSQVMPLLQEIEGSMSDGHDKRHAEWERKAAIADVALKRWKDDVEDAVANGKEPPAKPDNANTPQRPQRARLVMTDATVEAVAELLSQHYRGLLLHRDELSGWIGQMNKYGGNGDRPYWLEAWNGQAYTVDRVKNGGTPTVVPYNTVAMLGGIQPDKLSEVMSEADDGLTARFLYLWPEPVPPLRPRDIRSFTAPADLLRKLAGLEMAAASVKGDPAKPVVLALAPDAADAFQAWRMRHAAGEGDRSGLVASHFGKMGGYVLRLALVLEHLWWTETAVEAPKSVTRAAVEAAIRLVDDYFKPMAERVFGDAALPKSERDALTLARWVRQHRPSVVNARDLRRTAKLPGLSKAEDIKAALAALAEAGWLRPAPGRDGGGAGRPRSDYEVNPALWRNADVAAPAGDVEQRAAA